MIIRERPTNGQTPGATSIDARPDERRLRAWIGRLAVPRHRFANSAANAWVRDELASAFDGLGLTVRIQGPHGNVVALPPGAGAAPLTLVCAHYDSVPDCPGADDNGSGLGGMLECARLLSLLPERRAVGFVAFNAEEDGLIGSRDFVESYLPRSNLVIRSAHVLEMIGYRGGSGRQELPLPWVPAALRAPDYLGVLTKSGSNEVVDRVMAANAAPGLRVVGAKTWGPLHRALPDLTRSDHFPFWTAGIPAALWTDTGNFRNPHYHQVSDTPETLDYSFMTGVTELLTAVVSAESA